MTQSSKGGSPPPEGIDKSLIRELAELLHEAELSEIEIEQHGVRLRVARQLSNNVAYGPAPIAGAAAASNTPAATGAVEETDLAKHPGAVLSPMVGTVYVAAEPGAPPFVKVGDSVKEGQTVLIVEAMKTMNHILAPRAGRIVRILAQNGQAVEYGEPLMIIE